MRLIFVHGWSVTTTETYGQLPEALVTACANSNLQLDIQHIQLGKYVSFNDEVNLDDIARGLNQALLDLPDNNCRIRPFSCITHSTGGPVVRHWIDEFYGAQNLDKLPLKHLVMLAPANHGSALAVLGKKRVSRISSWLKGVETGQRVLDWLSLGSLGQRKLNRNGLDYHYAANNVYPFVLTGQGIDRDLYDFINSYLVEPGSDGVVRVAGANMNYRFFALEQTTELVRQDPATTRLVYDDDNHVRIAPSVPLGVYHHYSHSDDKMGIMKSISATDNDKQPVVDDIIKCLQVSNEADYLQRGTELATLTKSEQKISCDKRDIERYAMLIFHIHDDQGNHFSCGDFDILLLGGKNYQPYDLPKGFFMDRQMNSSTCNLVYYIDVDRMHDIKDGLFGIRVTAQPESGFAYYCMAEFRSDGVAMDDVVVANQTTYVDITLTRCVDRNVFRFAGAEETRGEFSGVGSDGGRVE